MKNFMLFFSIIIFAIAGCAPYFTKHFDESLFAVSENKKFSVEIITDKKDLQIEGKTVGFIVHDSNDEDVVNANLTITAILEESGRKKNIDFTATEQGGGLYTAESLDLKQGGQWQLRVKIRKDGSEDVAMFYFSG